MKNHSKNLFLIVLISVPVLFGNIPTLRAQPASLHNNLRNLLTYFQDTRDENIKQVIKEALALYTDDHLNDSLTKRLLIADSLLILNISKLDQKMVSFYAETVVRSFEYLLPLKEHPDYARSLNYLNRLSINITAQHEKALSSQEASSKKRAELTNLYSMMDSMYSSPLMISTIKAQRRYRKDPALFDSSKRIALQMLRYGEFEKDLPFKVLGEGFYQVGKERDADVKEDSPATVKRVKLSELLSFKGLKKERDADAREDSQATVKRVKLSELLSFKGLKKETNADVKEDSPATVNRVKLGELLSFKGLKKERDADVKEERPATVNRVKLGDLLPFKRWRKEREPDVKEKENDSGQTMNNAGNLMSFQGRYDKALYCYQEALSYIKRIKGIEHPEYASCVSNLALLYVNMGQYEKALPLSQQALAIRQKVLGEADPDYAASLNDQAVLYQLMGQFEKALPLYQQASSIIKEVQGEEHPDYANCLSNLVNLYQGMGQYEKAEFLSKQALFIQKNALGDKHPDYANSLNNLANLYQRMGHYEKALPLYQQALSIIKELQGEEHRDYASCLSDLAGSYEGRGEYEKALPLYQHALTIQKKVLGEEHPEYATGLYALAHLYEKMGEYGKAVLLCQQSLAVRKKVLGEEHPEYANSLTSLGLLSNMSGDAAGAAALLVKAVNIRLHHLAKTYSFLSENEKMTFLNKESNEFSFLPSVVFTNGLRQPATLNQVYLDELVLKGMVLEDQQQVLRSIRKSGDSAALQLYEQWQVNKALIGKQLLLPIATRFTYLDSLQGETATKLEQKLSGKAASFRNLQRSEGITAKSISQKLVTGQAVVEFLQFRLYNKKWTDSTMYAAMVLRPGDSSASFIPLFEEGQLERLLMPSSSAGTSLDKFAAIQRLYGKGTKHVPGSLPDSLYQLIWRPLEKYLTGIHTVYYAPAGLLHRVAFQALRPDTTHLLIDNYQLNQVLSTRAVASPATVTQKPVSAAIWGNIQYDRKTNLKVGRNAEMRQKEIDTTASSFNFYTSDTRGSRGGEWAALPGTRLEIDSLKKLFTHAGIRITLDSGTVATEEAFKALNGRSPKVLHLATHGFFLPVMENKPTASDELHSGGQAFTMQQNPMFRGGLVLAGGNEAWGGSAALPGREDGILTAYEIAQMDLSNTGLVVLSACETALGDLQGNEGVIGLQRAFRIAGVKQMIMSLWRVPDEATMELMMEFYKNWLGGQSTREALRSAQLRMKEKYSPYYWAAFVLVE